MAYSTVIRSYRDGSITLSDGTTPSAKTCVAPCMKGDLKWDITQDYKVVQCRGTPTGWVKGDKMPCKFSFSGYMAQLAQKTVASGDPTTLYEILTNRSSYFKTTLPGSGGVFALDMVFTIASNPAPGGTASDETVTFEDCVFTKISCSEADENIIQIEGMCLAEMPTVARV